MIRVIALFLIAGTALLAGCNTVAVEPAKTFRRAARPSITRLGKPDSRC